MPTPSKLFMPSYVLQVCEFVMLQFSSIKNVFFQLRWVKTKPASL